MTIRAMRWVAMCTLALGLTGAAPAAEEPRAPGDGGAEAARLAQATLQAMGGEPGWNAARFFRFDFVVEKGGKTLASYRHWWDRYTGRYRLEGTNKEGKPFLILFSLKDRTGRAWIDGKPAEAQKSAQMLEYAYGRHINDSYWILMPYKMMDPGAHLSYEGERTDTSGKKWEVVHLSFDPGIGLTPGDQYWAYLDPATHLMGRWDYELEGKEHEKGSWSWEGWTKVGPLMLSREKKEIGSDTVIRFPTLSVSENVDESAFAEPN